MFPEEWTEGWRIQVPVLFGSLHACGSELSRMHHQLLQKDIFVSCEGIKLKEYMVKQYLMLKAQ